MKVWDGMFWAASSQVCLPSVFLPNEELRRSLQVEGFETNTNNHTQCSHSGISSGMVLFLPGG